MQDDNLRLANLLLERIASGAPAEQVAELASEDLTFEIQGDPDGFEWVGKTRRGRQALADFVMQQRQLIQPDAFGVDDVLASADRAVIVGSFSSTVRSTGKVISSRFAIVLEISGDRITHFHMLEDSYAVSQAAH